MRARDEQNHKDNAFALTPSNHALFNCACIHVTRAHAHTRLHAHTRTNTHTHHCARACTHAQPHEPRCSARRLASTLRPISCQEQEALQRKAGGSAAKLSRIYTRPLPPTAHTLLTKRAPNFDSCRLMIPQPLLPSTRACQHESKGATRDVELHVTRGRPQLRGKGPGARARAGSVQRGSSDLHVPAACSSSSNAAIPSTATRIPRHAPRRGVHELNTKRGPL